MRGYTQGGHTLTCIEDRHLGLEGWDGMGVIWGYQAKGQERILKTFSRPKDAFFIPGGQDLRAEGTAL